MKKTISLLLAVIMMLSLSVTAFAQASYSGPVYKTYTVLGDSIPAGYGLDSYDAHAQTVGGKGPGGVYDNWKDVIPDSYPALVGEAVGAQETIPLAHGGFRSTEIRALLDDSYSGDDYTPIVCSDALACISLDEFWASKDTFIDSVTKADLITLNVGSNDTLAYSMLRMNAYLAQRATDSATANELENAISGLGTLGEAFDKMLSAADKMGETTGALNEFSAAMLSGYNSFTTNFPKVIEKIYQLNPDVKLAVVGMYNPFRDVKFTDSSLIKVGQIADQFVGIMNNYMQVLCKYASKYTYVNVVDTEVYQFPAFSDDAFMANFTKNVHPTVDGHAYMAQQILNALSGKDTSLIGSLTSGLKDLQIRTKPPLTKFLPSSRILRTLILP